MKAADILMWNNDKKSNLGFGLLYNRYAAVTSLMFPTGWVMPTQDQTATMYSNFGGHANAGAALKETGLMSWNSPNTGATNTSGLSGRASGMRDNTGSYLDFKNYLACHQNSVLGVYDLGYWGRYNNTTCTSHDFNSNYKNGHSIRLIWNGVETPPSNITDYDGNIYTVVGINGTYWLGQSWACTHLTDGTPIPLVEDDTAWSNLTTMGYSYPNGDSANI